jgi:hypothetical protein
MKLEMARHDGGASLRRNWSPADSALCWPGSGRGFADFLALPSGAVGDPALAPFLHPAQDGGGGKALRLKGVATAMD